MLLPRGQQMLCLHVVQFILEGMNVENGKVENESSVLHMLARHIRAPLVQ